MRESAMEPLGEEELQMPDLETSSAPLRPEETWSQQEKVGEKVL